MRLAILFILAACLVGCAPNYVKVSKVDASGYYMPFGTAKTGACIVEKKGNIKGITVDYKDQDCVVKVEGGAK